MHPAVFAVFEDICAAAVLRGPVLEVGAVPGPESLLRLPSLARVETRIGIDRAGGGDCGGYQIVEADANDMRCFEDARFGAVLCNSVLEHDRAFWRTLAEIRRVAAPGALIAIGVPGYAGMGLAQVAPNGLVRRLLRLSSADWVRASSPTLGVHNHPGDYYRFSEQAVREVFMDGLVDVAVRRVLVPPRFIAWGRKP